MLFLSSPDSIWLLLFLQLTHTHTHRREKEEAKTRKALGPSLQLKSKGLLEATKTRFKPCFLMNANKWQTKRTRTFYFSQNCFSQRIYGLSSVLSLFLTVPSYNLTAALHPLHLARFFLFTLLRLFTAFRSKKKVVLLFFPLRVHSAVFDFVKPHPYAKDIANWNAIVTRDSFSIRHRVLSSSSFNSTVEQTVGPSEEQVLSFFF